MAYPKYSHTANNVGLLGCAFVTAPGGKIYAIGGSDLAFAQTSDVRVFDPATLTWSTYGTMPSSISVVSAVLLDSTHIFIAGIYDTAFANSHQTVIMDISGGTPSFATKTVRPTPANSSGFVSTVLMGDGKVMVLDGYSGAFPNEHQLAYIFDPAGNSWSTPSQPTDFLANDTDLILLNDNRILVAGNWSHFPNKTWIYTPGTNTWSNTPTFISGPRFNSRSIKLADGKVMLIGGRDSAAPGATTYTITEIFDPAGTVWATGASTLTKRIYPGVTLLPNGDVLMLGGQSYEAGIWIWNSAERWNSALGDTLGSWTSVGILTGFDNTNGGSAGGLNNQATVFATGPYLRAALLGAYDGGSSSFDQYWAETGPPETVPPTVGGFTPETTTPGGTVTITGTGLTGATDVTFNGTPAASFTVVNDTTIIAVVPNGTLTGPLSVTGPGGTASSVATFSANDAAGDSVNQGSNNDTDEDIIRKHLNQALKGLGWEALIAAIATGERTNRENAELAFDQQYMSTASGLYLERKAADSGIERPVNMGMSDETFRQYALRVTNNKLTEEALLEILQVFYSDSSVRASSLSAASQPYSLEDGDDLSILIDEETAVSLAFKAADFTNISRAKAIEVAAAITRAFRLAGSIAYAAPSVDPQTGSTVVVIYSSSLGLSSSVRVTGGKAQNALQFATKLAVYTGAGSPTWDITVDAARGKVRFSTTSTAVDFTKLQEGDYVNVYGSEFSIGNRGSFTVTAVSVTYPAGILTQWFEAVNLTAAAQAALVQTAQIDLLYFRPTRNTIHATAERAVLVSVPGDEVDVVLPATSQAVSRHMKTGAYAQVNDSINITALERINNTVTATATATAHELSVGDWVQIDEVIAALGSPATVAGNNSTTTDYSWVSTSSLVNPTAANQLRSFPHVAQLDDTHICVAGGVQSTGVSNLHSEVLGYVSSVTLAGGIQHTLVQPAQPDTGATFAYMGFVRSTHSLLINNIVQFGGIDLATAGELNTTRLISLGAAPAGGLLAFAVVAPMAVELNNKSIISFGGASVGVAIKKTQIYNPTTNVWTDPGVDMVKARAQAGFVHTVVNGIEAVFVTGGRTLATGILDYTGTGDMGPILNSIEAYFPSIPVWTASTARMSFARFGHQMFQLSGNRLLIVGGWGYNVAGSSTTPTRLATCEVLENAGCRVINSMRSGRAFFSAVQMGNKLYVAGGTPNTTDIEILDLDTLEWSVSAAKLDAAVDKTAGVKLTDSIFVIAGGEVAGTEINQYRVVSIANDAVTARGLLGQHAVTAVPNANTFTYTTAESGYAASSSGVVTPVGAKASVVPGPFLFDADAGVAVTGIQSTIAGNLVKGLQYDSITIADASGFPDAEGWLVFDFGYSTQVYPVRYFGRLSNTELALDYSFKFPHTVLKGATVTLLQQKGPWVPANPQEVGSFYLTDSPAGRIAAELAIDNSAAAGVTVNKTVVFPGDRGLGNEGYPASGSYKLSDKVSVWGSDNQDADLTKARK